MYERAFKYQAFLKEKGSPEIGSLSASSVRLTGPFHAVIWDATHKEWIYAPGIVFGLLYDCDDEIQSMPVERSQAEQLARDCLHTELPSVDTLDAIIEDGARRGWKYGPPRDNQ